jgi:DNA-binding IclR family transcriptional regulator
MLKRAGNGSLTSDVPRSRVTSLEKALDVCEALSTSPNGLAVGEVARSVGLPKATVHRLLRVLKQRDYVRQDEETGRYALTLKVLDLSFRLLGRSELRLHAYPVVREYVLRTAHRAFVAVPASGEVTYIWAAGPDNVAMHTVYGREMPGHCALYITAARGARQLSCLRFEGARSGDGGAAVARFGVGGEAGAGRRLNCTCAPVYDYTGREVARVGLFAHASDETVLVERFGRDARELARLISLRLGYLPSTALAASA